MHIIDAEFRSLNDISVSELFGAIGVYILWSSRAQVRASYIGEGRILQRFAQEHVERFGINTEGYAAILDGGTEKERKSDAEILETALLEIGTMIDQAPAQNDAPGKKKGLLKHYEAGHRVIRFNVSGFHPLRWQTRLAGAVRISADLVKEHDGLQVYVDHPWRRVAS